MLLLTSMVGSMANECWTKIFAAELIAFVFLLVFVVHRPYRRGYHYYMQIMSMVMPCATMAWASTGGWERAHEAAYDITGEEESDGWSMTALHLAVLIPPALLFLFTVVSTLFVMRKIRRHRPGDSPMPSRAGEASQAKMADDTPDEWSDPEDNNVTPNISQSQLTAKEGGDADGVQAQAITRKRKGKKKRRRLKTGKKRKRRKKKKVVEPEPSWSSWSSLSSSSSSSSSEDDDKDNDDGESGGGEEAPTPPKPAKTLPKSSSFIRHETARKHWRAAGMATRFAPRARATQQAHRASEERERAPRPVDADEMSVASLGPASRKKKHKHHHRRSSNHGGESSRHHGHRHRSHRSGDEHGRTQSRARSTRSGMRSKGSIHKLKAQIEKEKQRRASMAGGGDGGGAGAPSGQQRRKKRGKRRSTMTAKEATEGRHKGNHVKHTTTTALQSVPESPRSATPKRRQSISESQAQHRAIMRKSRSSKV